MNFVHLLKQNVVISMLRSLSLSTTAADCERYFPQIARRVRSQAQSAAVVP